MFPCRWENFYPFSHFSKIAPKSCRKRFYPSMGRQGGSSCGTAPKSQTFLQNQSVWTWYDETNRLSPEGIRSIHTPSTSYERSSRNFPVSNHRFYSTQTWLRSSRYGIRRGELIFSTREGLPIFRDEALEILLEGTQASLGVNQSVVRRICCFCVIQ